MLFNYLVCIWHIIVSRFEDDRDSQSSMDLYAFIATIIIYVAYQLSFLITVTIKVNHYKLRNIYTMYDRNFLICAFDWITDILTIIQYMYYKLKYCALKNQDIKVETYFIQILLRRRKIREKVEAYQVS